MIELGVNSNHRLVISLFLEIPELTKPGYFPNADDGIVLVHDLDCAGSTRSPQRPKLTSFPGAGCLGMFSDKNKDNPASPAPTRKTKDGELSHSTPRIAGSTTAAM